MTRNVSVVGGHHDLPNPGDLLCAALAACEDATLRMVADALDLRILDLGVEVDGDADVRGCLSIEIEMAEAIRPESAAT